MILVTGGTGLVGSHLLFNLIKNGEKVRAIYRREKTLNRVKSVFSYYTNTAEDLYSKIEWVEADITNIPQLEKAFKGITQVYHCAAFVSFEPNKYKILRNINIKGTANIVNLCLSFSVKKLCYVSSIAALGQHTNPEKLIDEQTHWNTDGDHGVYAITKYGAELEVWRGTQEGLDAVIVNPGVILGAGFWHGAGSASIFKKIHNGLSFYTNGITGYVAVCDVVDAMIKLMNSAVKNEGFILVSENLSFNFFQVKTANALGVKPAKKEAKPWLLNLAWRLDWLNYYAFGKRRKLSRHLAKSLNSVAIYDNSKIKNAIDFKFKPIDDSIKAVSTFYLKDIQV